MYHQRFKTADERFDEKYFRAKNGCHIWLTAKEGRYPGFVLDGKNTLASHYAWKRATGKEVPEGMNVLHTCDDPRCVSPDHLFLGSHLENMKDKKAKNRVFRPSGLLNIKSRVTAAMCSKITAFLREGKSQQSVADIVGVSQQTISQISRGLHWSQKV